MSTWPDDPQDVPVEYVNRLSVTFAVDTGLVNDSSPAMQDLKTLDAEGWIDVGRTDTVDTELGEHKSPEHRTRFLEQSAEFKWEHLGPMQLGHSRVGSSVVGSDTDQVEFERVHGLLFPGSNPYDESESRAKQRFRDAQHVHTAHRQGDVGLLTRDKKDLLGRADAIKTELNGFLIVTPEDALTFVLRMKDRYEARSSTGRAE